MDYEVQGVPCDADGNILVDERYGSGLLIVQKTRPAQIKRAARMGDVFTATISTDTLDTDGEVLLPQGMDSTYFDRRPTVFWNHDYNRPLGRGVGRLRTSAHSIESDLRFAERPATHVGEWFPDTVKALVAQDVITAASVGIHPDEVCHPTRADRLKYGDGVQRIVARWKLLEWSVCPMQANPDALFKCVRKGLISAADADDLFGELVLLTFTTKRATCAVAPKPKYSWYAGLGGLGYVLEQP